MLKMYNKPNTYLPTAIDPEDIRLNNHKMSCRS